MGQNLSQGRDQFEEKVDQDQGLNQEVIQKMEILSRKIFI